MALAGISTLGILFGYAAETTAGTQPTTFTKLTRINSIGEINIEPEQIDASAIEDDITKYVAGRSDTGGSLPIQVNATPETITEWETLISSYNSLDSGKEMWFNTYIEKLGKSFMVKAQPPAKLPQPEIGQNSLLVMTINLTIVSYEGAVTAVKPT